jgi:Citrate synthase, C-terminal domain
MDFSVFFQLDMAMFFSCIGNAACCHFCAALANITTFSRRHLASSGVDVYSAIAGGVGALYGPLHGGANEAVLKMLERIGTVENIPAFIQGVKNRKEKMFGFGHRCARQLAAAGFYIWQP